MVGSEIQFKIGLIMSDNILPFVIFSCLYSWFLYRIAQDVIDDDIPEKWQKKLWYLFTAFGIIWMFGLIPSFIIFDVAGNPPDPYYAILSILAPLVGAFVAAAVGLIIRNRDSEDKPAAAP